MCEVLMDYLCFTQQQNLTTAIHRAMSSTILLVELEKRIYGSGSDTLPVSSPSHGLNGSGRKTWTDQDTGTFWLEDLLPSSLPDARIMTFAYDSTLAFSKSTAGIENFARDLLNRLRIIRTGEVGPFNSTREGSLTPMSRKKTGLLYLLLTVWVA